jgi:hypothetical protein
MFVGELSRTGRICDALELVSASYGAYYCCRSRDGSFAGACDVARAQWVASNPELARLERGAALVQYQRRHPARLGELKREGLLRWRLANPERAHEIAFRAGQATRAKTRIELTPKELARALRLLRRRGWGFRRVARVLGMSAPTLHRRISEYRLKAT